jgi:predicted patatin/cPLA2 family phospholipase
MAIEDLGLTPCIDKVFGSSAGGINGALYLRGDLWRAESLYYTLANTKRFVDIWRPLRGEVIVDMKFALNEVLKGGLSVDAARIRAAGADLHVAVTDVDGASLRMVSDFESSDDLTDALVAGCWLPMLAGPPFVFRGYRALDGGVLLEHPARAAAEGGCTHVLVLSTRFPRSQARLEPWRYLVREYLRTLNPKLADAFWKHSCRTVNYRQHMTRGNTDPSKGAVMLTVSPRPGWAELPKLEPAFTAFQSAMKEGYESLQEQMVAARRVDPRASTVKMPAG